MNWTRLKGTGHRFNGKFQRPVPERASLIFGGRIGSTTDIESLRTGHSSGQSPFETGWPEREAARQFGLACYPPLEKGTGLCITWGQSTHRRTEARLNTGRCAAWLESWPWADFLGAALRRVGDGSLMSGGDCPAAL